MKTRRILLALALAALVAVPALAWLPATHPAARTSADGCTVDVPRLNITRLCAAALPFTVAWDLDGNGTFERVETHRRGEQGWSAYGPPVRFPSDSEVIARWRVTIPCGEAVVVPEADCAHATTQGGIVAYDCAVVSEVNGCPDNAGGCETAGPPTVIEGEARYSPQWWQRMHGFLGRGRACT